MYDVDSISEEQHCVVDILPENQEFEKVIKEWMRYSSRI